jgi:hypothetical protein
MVGLMPPPMPDTYYYDSGWNGKSQKYPKDGAMFSLDSDREGWKNGVANIAWMILRKYLKSLLHSVFKSLCLPQLQWPERNISVRIEIVATESLLRCDVLAPCCCTRLNVCVQAWSVSFRITGLGLTRLSWLFILVSSACVLARMRSNLIN